MIFVRRFAERKFSFLYALGLAPEPLRSFLNGHDERAMRLRERITLAGYNSRSYYDLLRSAYRDFAIVCHQRSGSHFLSTALNNHPEIHCQDELLQLLFEPYKTYAAICQPAHGRINGAIIMYNQWEWARKLNLIPSKIIHLRRDPRKTAMSVLRNENHLIQHGPNHNPHARRGEGSILTKSNLLIDEEKLESWTSFIGAEASRFDQMLPTNRLEITYEDLCQDRDAEQISEFAAKRITEFLGVAQSNLTADLQKTS